MAPPARRTRRSRADTRQARPRDDVAEQLRAHLAPMTVPYLFVGAGFAIRYAGADNWEDLLRRFAGPTDRPYEFYASSANGDLPGIASLLAEAHHEMWWGDPAGHGAPAAEQMTARDSALKVAVAEYLADTPARLTDDADLQAELALFAEVVIDGIITTNFDPLLEHLRPDLHPFIGQEELLFADPQGIGEIYKIHGGSSAPNSLVLTSEDYEDFNERNAYLVAKLLTIFVEHPVLFIGYSVGDSNIQRLLVELARCLTDSRIEQLRDRLIFVKYDPAAPPSMSSTVISAGGFTIPIQLVTVPDFNAVFTVLADVKRQFPARLLRYLRKEVYDLVQTSKPTGQLFVEELDADADLSDVQVYAGVGALSRLSVSYVGLSREDLLNDVLEDREYDAARVASDALPLPKLGSRTTMIPVYKYLRGAGLLTASGEIADSSTLAPRLLARVQSRDALLRGSNGYRNRAHAELSAARDFADLLERADPQHVLYYLPFAEDDFIDLALLHRFLLDERSIFDDKIQPAATHWAKAVCRYDWLRFGRQLSKRPDS